MLDIRIQKFDGTTGDRILIGGQRSEAEIRWQMSEALRSMFSVMQTVATFFTGISVSGSSLFC